MILTILQSSFVSSGKILPAEAKMTSSSSFIYKMKNIGP